METKTKKPAIIAIATMLFVTLIILGLSYAYFQAVIRGDDSSGVNGKATNTFDINLVTENDGYINAPDLLLIKPDEVAEKAPKGTFKVVTGNNEHFIKYTLSLTELVISSNLQVADFKWQLICLNNPSKNKSGTFSGVNTGTMIILEDIIIADNATDNYEFRVWLEETDVDQLSLLNGSFKGKFSIEASMEYNPIVKLKDEVFAAYGGTEAITELPVSTFSSAETGAGGLYKTEDDYGTSYYFRGDHNLPNNVIFAGYQWKIVRIDGNGDIRMIYNGICSTTPCTINGNTAGASAALTNGSAFSLNNDNAYVGYMYGLTNQTTYESTHTNTNSSTIKGKVDTFYNGLSQEIKKKIVKTEYCSDRSMAPTGTPSNNTGLGYAKQITYYMAYSRLQTNKTPSLRCANPTDRLSLNIALITADEVSYAGGTTGTTNNNLYLRTNGTFWTMSPSNFITSLAQVWYVIASGIINSGNHTGSSYGVRPVIALNSNTAISSGNGSKTTPYIISE